MAHHLLLGTRKGLLIYREEKGKLHYDSLHFAGARVPFACRDPRNGTLWALLDYGHWGAKLHRSKDKGHNWEEVEIPKYPEGSELKPGVPAKTEMMWVLEPGAISEPNTLYIGTLPGGLFRSEDGGDSWTLIESLWNHPSRVEKWFGAGFDWPGIHSIVVDPRDPNHLLVGISVAGVFESWDRGLSWKPANKGLQAEYLPNPDAEVGQDPHILVGNPAHPDLLWQQNHCGIYRTRDGAQNWEDITEADGPAKFGFALAVDPEAPETAWVVPGDSDAVRMAIDGKLCVCRTEDGGKSWQALRKGLPQEHAFDIVFRHALDYRNDRLAFGSTTGSLFYSPNRGEQWELVNAHLPPVFSVRWCEY